MRAAGPAVWDIQNPHGIGALTALSRIAWSGPLGESFWRFGLEGSSQPAMERRWRGG